MQPTTVPRRYFLKGAVAGAVGIVLGQPGTSRATDAGLLKIEQPFHGAVLNHRHGRPTADGLTIQVAGSAPLGDRVTVGGQPAKRTGTAFSAEVLLREHETDIVAVCEGSQRRGEHRVRVVWDKHSEPRYRFAIDDNVFFLRDIAKKGYQLDFRVLLSGHAPPTAPRVRYQVRPEHLFHRRRGFRPDAIPRPLQEGMGGKRVIG